MNFVVCQNAIVMIWVRVISVVFGVFLVALISLYSWNSHDSDNQTSSKRVYAIHVVGMYLNSVNPPDYDQVQSLLRQFDETVYKGLVEKTDWRIVLDSELDRTLVKDASVEQFKELGIRLSLKTNLELEGDDIKVKVRVSHIGSLANGWEEFETYIGKSSDITVIAEYLVATIAESLDNAETE